MKNVKMLSKQSISVPPAKASRIISRGAEAVISLNKNVLIKERIQKHYRHSQLDVHLRKSRTRSEAKLLQKAFGIAPLVFHVDDQRMIIHMEYLRGELLRDLLSEVSSSEQERLIRLVGKQVGALHAQQIVHGDLTTSNMIALADTIKVFDFGLGYVSTRYEDKAVDLHLFHKALLSTHTSFAESGFCIFLESYRDSYPDAPAVLQQLEKVQQRGRYKRKKLVFG